MVAIFLGEKEVPFRKGTSFSFPRWMEDKSTSGSKFLPRVFLFFILGEIVGLVNDDFRLLMSASQKQRGMKTMSCSCLTLLLMMIKILLM